MEPLQKIALLLTSIRRWMEHWHWPWLKQVGHWLYWLRTHTYNKYHLIDCRHSRNGYRWGWLDRSELILFANMAILKEYVEKESHQTDWDYDEHFRRLKKEMDEILLWWDHGRKIEHDAYDDLLTKSYGFKDCVVFQKAADPRLEAMVFTRRGDPEWEEDCRRCQEAEDRLDDRDEEMLIRLIKIRGTLWS